MGQALPGSRQTFDQSLCGTNASKCRAPHERCTRAREVLLLLLLAAPLEVALELRECERSVSTLTFASAFASTFALTLVATLGPPPLALDLPPCAFVGLGFTVALAEVERLVLVVPAPSSSPPPPTRCNNTAMAADSSLRSSRTSRSKLSTRAPRASPSVLWP